MSPTAVIERPKFAKEVVPDGVVEEELVDPAVVVGACDEIVPEVEIAEEAGGEGEEAVDDAVEGENENSIKENLMQFKTDCPCCFECESSIKRGMKTFSFSSFHSL